MRIFGGDALKKRMEFFGMKPGESIEHPMISRNIESAQEKVEKHNFEIRKHLIEYDDVLNNQRGVIYQFRREILDGADSIQELIKDIIVDVISTLCTMHCPEGKCSPEQLEEIIDSVSKITSMPTKKFEHLALATKSSADIQTTLIEFILMQYDLHRGTFAADIVDEAEKWLLLESVDNAWKRHLQNIDHLKEGIGLRGYGQKNPLVEYKKESFGEFEQMMHNIKYDVVQTIFRTKAENVSAQAIHEISAEKERELAAIKIGAAQEGGVSAELRRDAPKVGRNDPCPCGSGKKSKHCCDA
jgi:preprotein translocase subunit SecA